jgi:tellurite resistance protein
MRNPLLLLRRPTGASRAEVVLHLRWRVRWQAPAHGRHRHGRLRAVKRARKPRMLPAMRLDSASLARLRDELQRRGALPSLPPLPGLLPVPIPELDVLATVERIAPICEALYLLMMADQVSDAREQQLRRGAVRALTGGSLRSAVINDMLARFAAAQRTHGRDQRLAQVTAQLAADRQDAEAAFTLASVMAIADETPEPREEALLEELREQLGISGARARTLLGEAGVASPAP